MSITLKFCNFSCPYVENESAYHTGTFNNATYFDKIDAIKNGDIDTFNELLQNEGISKWDLDDFEELYDNYESFISKANKELGGSIDATYGIKGIAAEGEICLEERDKLLLLLVEMY